MLIFHWTCCNNDKNNHKKCDPHRRPARPTATGPQPEAMMLQYFQDVMLFLFGCTKQGPNEPCWGPSGAHWPKWGHWGPKGHPLGPPLGPQWAPLAPQCRPPRPPLEGPLQELLTGIPYGSLRKRGVSLREFRPAAAYGNCLRELTGQRRFLTGIYILKTSKTDTPK